MGGSNFGRSHEPQQCGGAHLPNTLSSPNAATAGGIGGPPAHHNPRCPTPPKAPIERYIPASHRSKTGAAPEHPKPHLLRQGVPGGGAPRARQRRRRRAAALPRKRRGNELPSP